MTPDAFFNTLRSFVRHRPFQPFVIEIDGDVPILIKNPKNFAFGQGGGASYLDGGDIHLIDCEDVVNIKPVEERVGE